MRSIQPSRRAGFTLIEVLVAAALSMFLMVIITGAFQAGLDTYRELKAVGEQMEKLRVAANMIHHDLAMPHFGRFDRSWQGPFLKDQFLDDPAWVPPEEGFFRIVQGSAINWTATSTAPYRFEGVDGEGIPSFIATDHSLHFTVNALGRTTANTGINRYSDLFSTRLNGPDLATVEAFMKLSRPDAFIEKANTSTTPPTGNFISPWAEIAYYLTDTGEVIVDETAPPNPNPLKLFALRRRQRLAVMNPPAPPTLPTPPVVPEIVPAAMPYQEISHVNRPGQTYVNRPEDLPHPDRRWQGLAAGTNTTPYSTAAEQLGAAVKGQTDRLGDDIILTDVISFEVKPTWIAVSTNFPGTLNPMHRTGPAAVYTAGPRAGQANMDFPFDDLPVGDNTVLAASGARVFDTWTARNDPLFPANDYAANWNPVQGPTPTNPAFRIPLKVRVTALQIRIRIWDAKMKKARQITIEQDT